MYLAGIHGPGQAAKILSALPVTALSVSEFVLPRELCCAHMDVVCQARQVRYNLPVALKVPPEAT
jgi:hypothetical protein